MITHAGARTRSLYMWEKDDLDKRVKERLTIEQMQRFANKVWRLEGWESRQSTPTIHSTKSELSYCLGRADIFMNRIGSQRVTLIHELVHARGFGSAHNPHSVGFVITHLEMLSNYVGFSLDELLTTANDRGLI